MFERDERALHVYRQEVRHSCTCTQFNQSPLFFCLNTFAFSFLFLCSLFCYIKKTGVGRAELVFILDVLFFFCPCHLPPPPYFCPASSSADRREIVHTGPSLCRVWFNLLANLASDSQRNSANSHFLWSVCKLKANENKWKGHLILEDFKRGKCAFYKCCSLYCWDGVLQMNTLNNRDVRCADVWV